MIFNSKHYLLTFIAYVEYDQLSYSILKVQLSQNWLHIISELSEFLFNQLNDQ